ncbi:hypothetical protein [Leptospira santarosai]|uniref:hypothetical protein n=1 Tax=Leptospira santarosai TaxID=28183 RepID=UPI0024AF73B6|nr:hypothetical protein [Leptospira santarosai]MDI7165299.1 hypothetical protein [Leptospira santarosai]
MKRSTFETRLAKIEEANADWDYSLCETTQEKVNWEQNFTPLVEGRIFFFATSNTIVYDDPHTGLIEYRNPTEFLKAVQGWFDDRVFTWESDRDDEERYLFEQENDSEENWYPGKGITADELELLEEDYYKAFIQ